MNSSVDFNDLTIFFAHRPMELGLLGILTRELLFQLNKDTRDDVIVLMVQSF
jgi:hypothetical protein